MKQRHTHTTRDYGTRYAAALRELAASEGRRNRMLLGVATRGLLARRAPAEVERDLLDAGAAGRSPLTVAEVRRAVQRAERDGYGGDAHRGRELPPRPAPRSPHRDAPVPDDSAKPKDPFTTMMTDAGEAAWSRWRDERLRTGLREWETPDEDLSPLAALRAASPCPLDADTIPARMTALQVAALFDDGSEHIYTGPREGAKNPANVREAGDFVRRVCHGIRNVAGMRLRFRLPQLIMPNPVKAEGGLAKNGTPSYRCDDAVAALRNAVVEVDPAWKGGEGGEAERAFYAEAVRRQALFWLGVVTSRNEEGLMPLPVRCIVYSGNKSLHAVLRIGAWDRGKWDVDWRKLRKALPDVDGSFQTILSQSTRLAGAERNDEKASGVLQSLLWVAAPNPAWRRILGNALAEPIRR